MRLMTMLAGVVFGVLVIVIPMATHAQAQSPVLQDYRMEAFADVAWGLFGNGVSKSINTADFGAGFGWRVGLQRRVGAEFRTARKSYHDVSKTARDSEHLDAWLVTANALLHFRSGKPTQTYLLAGFGFIDMQASKLCTTCVWADRRADDGSKTYRDTGGSEEGRVAAYQFGGGFKTAMRRNLSLRGELVYAKAVDGRYDARFLDGVPNTNTGPWDWMRMTIGVGFHF